MRPHPEIGERILSADPAMQAVGEAGPLQSRAMGRHRLSRWSGGPHIPLGARIIAACDALEAMTSDRCYQAARSLPDALAELRRCAGTQFDPDVVVALCARLELAPAAPNPSPASSLA